MPKPARSRMPLLLTSIVALGLSLQLTAAAADDPALDESGQTDGALYETLEALDSALFQAGFVDCDADAANAIFTEQVEFYHDQTGFTAGEQTRDDIRRLTENCPAGQGITRTLQPGSLRVYPIQHYGAVQTGVHRFEKSGESHRTVARFVHLWQQRGEEWRLARVLSFDHQSEAVGVAAAPQEP